jgi:hypothetical protein
LRCSQSFGGYQPKTDTGKHCPIRANYFILRIPASRKIKIKLVRAMNRSLTVKYLLIMLWLVCAGAYAQTISEMSLEDLDRRCDQAREEKIAPLREAAIEECKQGKRNDPAWCERFNADFGDGGKTVNGSYRPRMFDDIPECVDALSERNRRGRGQ